jgi:hypothetical protein
MRSHKKSLSEYSCSVLGLGSPSRVDTGGAQVQGPRSKQCSPHGPRAVPLNNAAAAGVHTPIMSRNQPGDSRPNPSQNWPAVGGNTAKKTPLPPLWTWSQGPSTMPNTDSKVSGEEAAGGERGSEGRGGGEWHNVEGKWGSVGSLSTVNSVSADDIFESTSSPSSSPPASRHTVDVIHGSSSSLTGASGPLNRFDGLDSTAISPSANVSSSSPAVHPPSFLLEESETSRGDDESSGDDCDSCLYSVSSLDRNPDSFPYPETTLSAGSVPLSLPVSLRVPTKASHSSLSARDRSFAVKLARKSPRSRVGVGVGSRTDTDLSADPGPAAGIPSGKHLEGRDEAVAFLPRIPLISDRAVTAPVPVEGAAPAAVEVAVEVADGSVSSGGVGSKSALRAVVEGMTPLPPPLTRLSNEMSCEGDVVHTGVTDSGTRPKSKSKSNSKDKSEYISASEGKGDTVGVALAAAGRHLGEVQIRTQGGDDKDTDINADEDAGNQGDRVVLVPPHDSPAPGTEERTVIHTARDADLEGDGTGAETEMPPGLLGLEMLEEESV